MYVRLLAGLALISAGAFHTFPSLWKLWENNVMSVPNAHYYIGAVGLFLGIINMIILLWSLFTGKDDAK